MMNTPAIPRDLVVLKRPRVRLIYNLVLIAIIASPFGGVYVELGGTYGISNTAAILAFIIFLIDILTRNKPLSLAYSQSFKLVLNVLAAFYLVTLISNFIFFISADIDPSVWAFFNNRFGTGGMSIFRTYLKPVQALVSQSISYSWFLLPLVIISSKKDLLKISWFYVISSTFQAILGIVHLAVFALMGVNLFPIYRGGIVGDEVQTQTSMIATSLGPTLRANGLAGEPGGLALYCCFGMAVTLLFLLPQLTERKLRAFGISCFILQFIGMMITYSTRGYLLTFLLGFIFFLTHKNKILLIPLTILSVGFIYYLVGGIPDIVQEVFSMRFLARFGFDDFDYVYFEFLKQSPEYLLLGSGFGNIHLLMEPYARDMIPFEIGNITPKMGLLFILSTSGVVGALILFLLPFNLFFKRKKLSQLLSISPTSAALLACTQNTAAYMFFAGIILQFNVLGFFWVSAGLAIIEVLRKEATLLGSSSSKATSSFRIES
jgi:hypothetical protein